MIKRALLLILPVSALVTALCFAAERAPDEAALKDRLVKLEKQSWEAWKNRDGKFFQEFLSDDHVEVGFGGVANKKEIVDFVGSPVYTVKSYELDQFELKMLDKNTALLTYRESQDTTCHKPVPSPCWVSSLYMKRGDRWLNVLYQQTQITN
ncbi:MAG TPA: nuclear transport factor 2 family protein [Chthoniobacterales bacterium]